MSTTEWTQALLMAAVLGGAGLGGAVFAAPGQPPPIPAVEAPQPSASAASAVAPKSKRASIVVTGGGKPIAQAEVQLQSEAYPTFKATTDDDGEVSIEVSTTVPCRVRVIAQGWSTWFGDVKLSQGSRHSIDLTKPAPDRTRSSLP